MLWTVRGDLLFIGYNKFYIAPNYNKTDRFLKTNIKELSYVAGELCEMDYDYIKIIRSEDGYIMKAKRENIVYKTMPITNELIKHIEPLYENGIQDISCGRDSVNFTMWSTMDESRGIIYSDTGTKPNGEQLIEVRQLSKANWYYYVHNYEKAKELTPDRFK